MKAIQLDLDGPDRYRYHLIACARRLAKQTGKDAEAITKKLRSCKYKDILLFLQTEFEDRIMFFGSFVSRRKGIHMERKIFTDETLMPWGDYVNWPMRSVPYKYLKWLSTRAWMGKWGEMLGYINYDRGIIDGKNIFD
ncbi:hypothetical protein ACFLQL_03680 [Verrucomicrobiota bacterium]